jgi:hypothetical protein
MWLRLSVETHEDEALHASETHDDEAARASETTTPGRRAAAAALSREFAAENDLGVLLGIATLGLGELFGGECTIQLGVEAGDPADERQWLPDQGVPEVVLAGLTSAPAEELGEPGSGVLLIPQAASGSCRAWVQFAAPRRVSADELVVGDLFVQAFALAVDRVVDLEAALKREEQLRAAIDAHRVIGQATGILMERHRLTAGAAFTRLRTVSQNRNIKLREIAERLIETGLDPENG